MMKPIAKGDRVQILWLGNKRMSAFQKAKQRTGVVLGVYPARGFAKVLRDGNIAPGEYRIEQLINLTEGGK